MRYTKLSGVGDQEKIAEIASVVKASGVIAYPTDTIYGLGCNPLDSPALDRLYEIKRRPKGYPLLILLDSADRLSRWCDGIPMSALRLMKFWPAPLTLVVKVKDNLPDNLMQGEDSLGFRVPALDICRALCTAAGGALTSTSINRRGMPPIQNPGEIAMEFGIEIDMLVDIGPLPPSSPSTIVRCIGNETEIIRKGAFPLDR